VSKCLVPRFWRRSVLRSVPKCPRVSRCRSVLWPKCPVTPIPCFADSFLLSHISSRLHPDHPHSRAVNDDKSYCLRSTPCAATVAINALLTAYSWSQRQCNYTGTATAVFCRSLYYVVAQQLKCSKRIPNRNKKAQLTQG